MCSAGIFDMIVSENVVGSILCDMTLVYMLRLIFVTACELVHVPGDEFVVFWYAVKDGDF